jgi:hypothetical protein
MDEKYLNIKTIASIVLLLFGILFYIYWGVRYGVWYDIGIYSITILFVLGGIFGFLLTTHREEETE